MTERQLATVETVTAITPIADADQIEAATIRGWTVVVKKGEFAPGDKCVYLEIDAMLDVEDERFAFLAPRGVRTDAEGNKGHVLRTAKLRGTISQGLALPIAEFPEVGGQSGDVTELLGIRKWEPPVPASLAGEVFGMRPSWIHKTDEERIQNIGHVLELVAEKGTAYEWRPTLKIDGTSASFAVDPGTERENIVCSRNLDLKPSDENTLWRIAAETEIHKRLNESFPGRRAVAQGEVFGEGIQGNPLKMKGQHLRLFNIWCGGIPLAMGMWPDWAKLLAVPTVSGLTFPATVEQAVADVDGLQSPLGQGLAEGVVWRSAQLPWVWENTREWSNASWKVISNRYLLKHSD